MLTAKQLREMPFEELEKVTEENAKRKEEIYRRLLERSSRTVLLLEKICKKFGIDTE